MQCRKRQNLRGTLNLAILVSDAYCNNLPVVWLTTA